MKSLEINKDSRVNVTKDMFLFNGAIYKSDILKVQEVRDGKALVQQSNGRIHWLELTALKLYSK